MSLIQISNLTFGYEGSYEPVFENVSLSLDSDWRLGLVGRNGRGKTTLLRLLNGELPFSGSISSAVDFDYFPFPVPQPQEPVWAVLDAAAPQAENWQFYKELAELELPEDVMERSFATLSNGEQTRCLLAALFLRGHRFLLIDEPTSHLDMAGREVVSRYLRRQKGFLLVSHDRAFLDGCVDHILALNREGVEVQQGNFSSWWENKQRQDAFEQAQNKKLLSEIDRLGDAMRRTAGWADQIEGSKIGSHAADRGFIGHKSAKMMKRAKAAQTRRQNALEEMQQLLRNAEKAPSLELRPLTHPKSRLIEARELAPDYGNGQVCAPVSFTLRQGDRVTLTGRNGAGKSSLLKLMAGVDIPHTGTLTTASNLTVSVVPQDSSFLQGLPADYAQACGVDVTRFLHFLRKLDFPRSLFERDMAQYSAGQKKKVLLARSLSESAHLYLWDEPLNYIDVFSRMQLEELLGSFPGTLVLVEHDRQFLETLNIRRLSLEPPLP